MYANGLQKVINFQWENTKAKQLKTIKNVRVTGLANTEKGSWAGQLLQ